MPGTPAQNDSRRNPDDLRFTKTTINLDCPGHLDCENIYDILYALENRKLIPRDLPSLHVISHGAQFWTLENELLYIYRISPKVKRVSVVHVSNSQKFLENFLAENSTRDIKRMSSSEFFPRVKSCNKSPTSKLCLYRADCASPPTVKNLLETRKIKGRSPAGKLSARSVSSSKAVTSRISFENSEPFTPSASLGSKGAYSDSKMSTAIVALSVGFKSTQSESKTSTTRHASLTVSSGRSSPSEDSMDIKTPCYPAVRTMTGHLLLSMDSLRISSAVEEHENTQARKRRFSFPSFADRPSTCHANSKFSCSPFPSTTRSARSDKPSSETAFSGLAPLTALPDSQEHSFHSRFSATLLDISRENKISPFVSKLSVECQDNSEQNVPQDFAEKFPDPSPENVSHGFPSKFDIDEKADPDDDFELEAFVIPDFCYPPPKAREIKWDDDDISSSSSSQKPNGSQASSSRDRLDRSVSSCSSSTERPTKKPFGGTQRRSGSEGGPRKNSPLLQKTAAIGRSGSPLGRASVSAERPMKCHLSAEHEFEVSKQILLKHMKKAFFSVC